jgi:hypothetical protein
MRVAGLLKIWRRLSSLYGHAENGQRHTVDGKYFTPILEAVQTDNDEFFSDIAIAIRFRRREKQFHVNAFLAEYSLLMLGKQPVLTFTDLQKILHWIEPADLRKKIRTLRKAYGECAVPLKRGLRGRPRKK